jgi:hypothetical protein
MVDTRSSPTGRRTPPRSAKKTGPKVKVAGRAKGTPNAPKSCPRNWKEAIAKFKSCRKSAFDKIHDLNHQCNLEGKGGQISLALVTLIRPPPPTKGKRKTPDDVVVLAPKSAGLGPPDLLNVALALTNKMGPKENPQPGVNCFSRQHGRGGSRALFSQEGRKNSHEQQEGCPSTLAPSCWSCYISPQDSCSAEAPPYTSR